MHDPQEHPFYQNVLRMVLWGDPKEKVIEKLGYSEVSGDDAEALYQAAFDERVNLIRADYRKRAGVGVLFMLLGIGLFWIFWFGLGFISRLGFSLAFGAVGYGLWKFVDGTAGVIMAAKQQGPVEE